MNFVGEISYVVSDAPALSVTFAIVPGLFMCQICLFRTSLPTGSWFIGNSGWNLRNGINYGESHAALCSDSSGVAVISHPIDSHYQVSSSEGWPIFIFELWDRTYDEMKGFYGCGSTWLPSKAGKHCIEIPIWRNYPTSFIQGLRG